MSKNEVSHSGIIQEIVGNTAKISIMSKAGCLSCAMNKSCSASDVKEKIIEVNNFAGNFRIGESVDVGLAESAGLKALFLGYLLPFLVLFITLIIASNFYSELTAGLIALFSLVPYYFSLYILQNRIKKEFSFLVHKL